MSLMARFPMKARFVQRPPNPRQLHKRNDQYRRNYRNHQKELMNEAFKDKPAIMMVQVEGHYLNIKDCYGKEWNLILPFAEAKKHLHSFVFYRANTTTIVNVWHIQEIKQDETGSWVILLHDCMIILDKDDEKLIKLLQELLLDPRVFKEIRRLSRKRFDS
jgi:DNA-binding LytR/AlgR family response regulator